MHFFQHTSVAIIHSSGSSPMTYTDRCLESREDNGAGGKRSGFSLQNKKSTEGTSQDYAMSVQRYTGYKQMPMYTMFWEWKN